jgi:predicted Zn-dependent peptidase
VAAYMGAPGRGAEDIEATLQKLADLRDQGILSPEEFESKKRELLSRI